MPLHQPTLALACVASLALSAVALAICGAASRTYRGFWWWGLAQGLLTVGLALLPFVDDRPLLLPLVNVLCLQWPVTVLVGLRRHYARHEWRAPEWVDPVLLAAAYAAWFVAWVAGADQASRVMVFASGSAALHVYAGAMVASLREFRPNLALKAFVVTAGLSGLFQISRVAAARGEPEALIAGQWLLPGALLVGLVAVTTVCMALLLTSERTEANLLATQRKLRVLADMDVLTGMANRRHFLERCQHLLDAPGIVRSTVVMFDIDHFKQVNDLLGHAVGDDALRQIGYCVGDALREHDVAGRLGGDEFAVLLPGASIGDAMTVASRIVARLAHRQVAPRVAPLSLSFGVVQTQAEETINEALRRADQALYEAKRQGRNRAVAASGDAEQPVFSESRPMGLAG